MLSVYYIGIVQALFAALLIWKKPQKAYADKILILWLLIIGVEMLYSLLNLTYLTQLPDLIIIPFAYGPLLLFYTLAQVSRKKVKLKSYFLHAMPIFILLFLAFFWKGPANLNTNDLLSKNSYALINILNYLGFIISMVWYWILVFKLINSHKKVISHRLSYENDKLKLTWVKSVAWWILGAFIVSGFTYIIFFVKNIYPFNPIEIYHLGLLIFIFSISYYGIHQPNVYKEIKDVTVSKKLQSEYDEQTIIRLDEKLSKFMSDNKPYLNRELTLNQLTIDLNENQQLVSYYLNHHLKKNFFTFINEFRVLEAKRLIDDPNTKNLTLLAIGYEAGFNSKSSFNALFKKITGKTPSEYQKLNKV